MKPNKVGTVMREFKAGKLKSSSGQKVTNPKQAIAIGLSEAGMSKPKKESDMKKYSKGGSAMPSKMGAVKTAAPSKDGVASKGKTKAMQVKMAKGGMTKKAYGGKC